MRVRLAVGSGLATALAAGSTALAAPPWSPPRDISAAVPDMNLSGLDFGADGAALGSWTEIVGLPGGGVTERSRFIALLPGGVLEDRGTLLGPLTARPQVFGRNDTVLVREDRRNPRAERTRIRLDAMFGTTSGPLFARTRRVAVFRAELGERRGPALAASEDGEVAVAWTELDRRRKGPRAEAVFRVRVAISRGGRRFGRPRTLGHFPLPTRDTQAVAAAYGRRGELLVAYGAARVVGRDVRPFLAARVRPRATGPFGRRQRLGPRKESTDLAVAAVPSGRMAVVWSSQDAGEGTQRPRVVRAALRAPGRRFGAPAVLDPGEFGPASPSRVAVALAPDGSATAAWGGVRGRDSEPQFPVRTATAPPGRGFGPVSTLASTGVVGSVAAAPDSRVLVTWTNTVAGVAPPPAPPGDVIAALRPAGAQALGAPETVSTTELEDLAPATAAFDPLTGRASVIWPAADRDAQGRVVLGTARMRLATRDG